jgi:uncharacterized protein (TIGR00299 family) protein
MRIAYLDCFAGIAGDMFLGALMDAGVPADVLHQATAALGLGATLKIETVDRSGISATKVHVLENGRPAEGEYPSHTHAGSGADNLEHQRAGREFERTAQLKTQHQHKTGHSHSHPETHAAGHDSEQHHHKNEHGHDHAGERGHGHSHVHGRSLTEIRRLIEAAPLATPVKSFAIHAFELLGASEAKIHNVPVDQIHFHEVGAVDAIVDIVAVSAGIHHLGVNAWYASAVNVGGGMVECAHGTFPVPAPATADLLRGFPTYSAHVQKELVTPTGAALLRTLNPSFGPQPAMRVDKIGYGAGTRNPKDFPNVLRLSIGTEESRSEQANVPQPEGAAGQAHAGSPTESHNPRPSPANSAARHQHDGETVTVLETALDDLSPQLLAYVAEKALAAGALDVMLTPVVMKKGRPGTLLTVLCNPADSTVFEQLILTETSTLGVRIRQDRRACLERSHTTVQTAFGPIRMKVGTQDGNELNAAPEYEDCRAAAQRSDVPLKQVQQAAIAAYAGKRAR